MQDSFLPTSFLKWNLRNIAINVEQDAHEFENEQLLRYQDTQHNALQLPEDGSLDLDSVRIATVHWAPFEYFYGAIDNSVSYVERHLAQEIWHDKDDK